MILFLDDDPNRAALAYQRMTKEDKERTIWCQTALEAIITLWDYRDRLEFVTLDHDLGGETYVNTKREDCGMEVVRFLEKKAKDEPEEFDKLRKADFVVHTYNVYAGSRMLDRLKSLKLNVRYQPFGT